MTDAADVERPLRRAWRIRIARWLALSCLAPPLLTAASSQVGNLDVAYVFYYCSAACGLAGAVGAIVSAVRGRKRDPRVAGVTGVAAFVAVALLSLPWAALWTFFGIMLHAKW
jgi:hypothetical protein